MLQLFAVYFAPLRSKLGLTIPTIEDWIILVITFVVPLVVVETQKALARWMRERGPAENISEARGLQFNTTLT
ncbi:MAG TPA: hypothetical protein VMS98_11865 [Thermoanaerobaculia bacterium]|nr:hypothetical protein [Thermoanaerobaculia bacterium]